MPTSRRYWNGSPARPSRAANRNWDQHQSAAIEKYHQVAAKWRFPGGTAGTYGFNFNFTR